MQTDSTAIQGPRLLHDEMPSGASADNFRQILAELPAAVYSTDASGLITFFNEAAAELWGRRPGIGKELWCGSWRIFDSDGVAMDLAECPMAVALREGRSVRGVEIIVERPDGARRHVLPHPTPLRDASGVLIGAVNMLVDIEDRVADEYARRRLAAIVESSDDAIVSKTLDGTITSWNRAAERLFGYTEHEIVGRSITMLVPPDRLEEEQMILEQLRRGVPIDHYETLRRRKDGTLIAVSLTVSPVRDHRGRIIGASKIARDVTERQRIQHELEEARDQAQAASRVKDEFFAMLSHELRTPLSPVLLTAGSALEDPNLTPALRADLELILDNVTLEARLLDDMLDFAKITRQKLELVQSPLIFESVLRNAVRVVAADAAEKGIELSVSLAAGDVGMSGDPVRLQQVCWNVLRNAVKFTPAKGRIHVVTRVDLDRGLFVAEIADTGIGMTSDELQRVFEPFVQGHHGDKKSSQRYGGLGIGLALARQLVSLHGGRIHAASAGPGTGSVFTIELPISAHSMKQSDGIADKSNHQSRSNGSPQNDSAHPTVLLVDDHQPTCIALSRFFVSNGYQVLVATSLREARSLIANNEVDLLLSDIGLPDGSGYELMEEIRLLKPNLQAIAVSGYGMADDIERSRLAGFVEHCTKPIQLAGLRQVLARLGLPRI